MSTDLGDRWYRIQARVAIITAWFLSRQPPDRIGQVIGIVGRGARPATSDEADRARGTVCALSRRCAGQGCVQRSIAVVVLCRLSGSAPNWRTGFGIEPFIAHAWVETDGRPVGEPAEVARYFVANAVDVAA